MSSDRSSSLVEIMAVMVMRAESVETSAALQQRSRTAPFMTPVDAARRPGRRRPSRLERKVSQSREGAFKLAFGAIALGMGADHAVCCTRAKPDVLDSRRGYSS